MKPFSLMPDSRLSDLMKVAEECIGLINLDIEPNAALKKVAADNFLTDKEVELVSHAINNSRQLAQYESADDKNKDAPFVLTNAKLVNADRYGKASEDSDTAAQTQDQPDAVEINDKLRKEASASFSDEGDYRLRTPSSIDAGALRSYMGVADFKKRANVSQNVIHPAQAFDVGIDEARTRANAFRDEAIGLLQKVGSAFRNITGPSFAEFEKVASVSDVPKELVDLVYSDANLGKYGVARFTEHVKTARVHTTKEIMDLIDMVKCAQDALDSCASVLVAKEALEGRRAELLKTAALDISLSPQGLDKEIQSAPGAYLGLGESPETSLMDIAGERKPEGYDPSASVPQTISQEMKNFDTQSELKELMHDPYIGGYNAPEVIEAYNAAKSVNPNFGQAQLISYMRQHLATSGSVPLELQVRAGRHAPQGEKE